MKLLSLFRKRKVEVWKESDFKKAPTRGGFPKEIYDVIRFKDRRIWNVIGVVLFEGRRIFVIWELNGRAYVCHERDRKFDLLLESNEHVQ